MSTDALVLPGTELASRPLVSRLHDWVATVDHKRLGILYMMFAMAFLLIGGAEAAVMRIQLIRPHNDFVSPQVFNRLFTIRNHHDLLRDHALHHSGFAKLPHPTLDWGAGYGFPTPECFQFLDDRFRWPASLLQPGWSQRTLRSGKRARRGMVRLRTIDFADVFGWPQYGLLDSGSAGLRLWQHRHGDQHYRYRSLHALHGHDVSQNAAVRASSPAVMASGLVLCVSPLPRLLQIMLLVDRYLGGHFFDTQAGGSAVIWMHFFWVFGRYPKSMFLYSRPSLSPQKSSQCLPASRFSVTQ